MLICAPGQPPAAPKQIPAIPRFEDRLLFADAHHAHELLPNAPVRPKLPVLWHPGGAEERELAARRTALRVAWNARDPPRMTMI